MNLTRDTSAYNYMTEVIEVDISGNLHTQPECHHHWNLAPESKMPKCFWQIKKQASYHCISSKPASSAGGLLDPVLRTRSWSSNRNYLINKLGYSLYRYPMNSSTARTTNLSLGVLVFHWLKVTWTPKITHKSLRAQAHYGGLWRKHMSSKSPKPRYIMRWYRLKRHCQIVTKM
jgi:hypothetical protein